MRSGRHEHDGIRYLRLGAPSRRLFAGLGATFIGAPGYLGLRVGGLGRCRGIVRGGSYQRLQGLSGTADILRPLALLVLRQTNENAITHYFARTSGLPARDRPPPRWWRLGVDVSSPPPESAGVAAAAVYFSRKSSPDHCGQRRSDPPPRNVVNRNGKLPSRYFFASSTSSLVGGSSRIFSISCRNRAGRHDFSGTCPHSR